jgi:hypothetical protein
MISVAGWAFGVLSLGRIGGRAPGWEVEAEGGANPGTGRLDLRVARGEGVGAA